MSVSPGWESAIQISRDAAEPLAPVRVRLDEACGLILEQDVVALNDVPVVDTSAMDGWAVSGPGPWLLDGIVETGRPQARTVTEGHAVGIGTGGAVPPGATSVVRSEHGYLDPPRLVLTSAELQPLPNANIRRRGEEIRAGDALVTAGSLLNPWSISLAASVGLDRLSVTPMPRVDLIVTGEEVRTAGVPGAGHVRDAFGPALSGICRALQATPGDTWYESDPGRLHDLMANASTAPVIVTTGGTAQGPSDHVRTVLLAAGAKLLIDGVDVRPGRPTLLSQLPDGRHVVSLPGNPLAAVIGMCLTLRPLVTQLRGDPDLAAPQVIPVGVTVERGAAVRAVPVSIRGNRAFPTRWRAASMLRGLVEADGIAMIPPGGVAAGDGVSVLQLLGV